MARLNDPQPESLEAVKKRFLRQNREIARVNSTQSIRIRNLEDETTRLLTENIELREQVIKLQASLDRREKARVVVENVEATKRKLEEKVAELDEIVKGLGQAMTTSPEVRQPKAPIISNHQRIWKSQLSLGEMHDGQLPAIHEDARSRRSSLNVEEHRRSSLNFEEINLPPPRPENNIHDDSDEDLRPPVTSLLDTRPRRRRDSAMALDLGVFNKPAVPSKAQQPAPSSENTISKASKRKFEREAEAVMELVADMEFKFSRISERPIEVVRSTGEVENAGTTETLENAEEDQVPEEQHKAKEEEAPSKIVRLVLNPDARRRKEASVSVDEEYAPPMAPAISTSSRRALGPKSTNSDPTNSPLKQANIASALAKDEKNHDKLQKVDLNPPPPMKAYRSSHTHDTDPHPPDAEPTNVRASRRAKSGVNYALPNLRDKMRRDDKAAEAARGEGRAQKRSSAGRSRSKESIVESEFVVKREDPEDADDEDQWLNLPPMPPPTQTSRSEEDLRKQKEIGIGGLLERKPSKERERREKELESGLPPSVISQRKRRTSSLHCPVGNMGPEGDGGGRPRAVSGHGEGRRKTVTTEGPDPSIDCNHRVLIDASTGRRKVYSHLPPSSTNVEDDDGGFEGVRGSRRVTLGGGLVGSEGARTVRGIKSSGHLMNEDAGDDDERRRLGPPGPGIGARRRSMML
ncbi:hypothetical protein L873DRAFT_1819745 [Choiromyces venosus 120613-1]|uniref:Shugoshin C-terminal domain-containing protein n=1 Tax=Choiromyces venosus 120613-1 TaxID=1336337 RepID=A0A3N4IYL6_9PEZI|nr:hypothetical protein L873DRAFT_1819745 [Choiromyces venosus 120613-1]